METEGGDNGGDICDFVNTFIFIVLHAVLLSITPSPCCDMVFS
jgi:hypothetical protein